MSGGRARRVDAIAGALLLAFALVMARATRLGSQACGSLPEGGLQAATARAIQRGNKRMKPP